MARSVDDPLVPLPVRLPKSTVDRLKAQALERDCSVSDVLRAHLTLDAAKPLGKPRPRRREPKELGPVSAADPLLLRQLASLGNNMNQLARAVNAGALAGKPADAVQILIVLRAIEQQLSTIAERHAH
jgi:hypothetical protein